MNNKESFDDIWGGWVGQSTPVEYLQQLANELGCVPGAVTDEQIDSEIRRHVNFMLGNGAELVDDEDEYTSEDVDLARDEVEYALESRLGSARDEWAEDIRTQIPEWPERE